MRNYLARNTLSIKQRLSVASATGDDRLDLGLRWIEEEDRSVVEVEELLSIYKSTQKRNVIVGSWFEQEGRTTQDLLDFLPFLRRDGDRSAYEIEKLLTNLRNSHKVNSIAKSWVEQEERTAQDLVDGLAFLTDEDVKFGIVKSWLKQEEGGTAQNLRDFLPLLANHDQKFEVVGSWLEQEGRTAQDLCEVLPLFPKWHNVKLDTKIDSLETKIIGSWAEKEGRTAQDLQAVLPLLPNSYNLWTATGDVSSQSKIVESWLEQDGRTAQEVLDVLPLLDGHTQRDKVIGAWVGKEGRTAQDLRDVLPCVSDAKYEVAKPWLEQEGRTAQDLCTVLPVFTDASFKPLIIRNWLEKEVRTTQDLCELLPFFKYEFNKFDSVKSWLEQDRRTAQDLDIVLPILTNPKYESDVVELWLGQEGRTCKDLCDFLPLITGLYSTGFKYKIVESWLKQEGGGVQDLRDFLPVFTDTGVKSAIVGSWATQDGRTAQDLHDVLPLLTDLDQKSYVVKLWLGQEGRIAQDLHDFLPLLTDYSHKYEVANSWLKQETRETQDLIDFLPLLKDNYHERRDVGTIVKLWLEGERTSQELTDILPVLIQPNVKYLAVTGWFQQKGRTAQDLHDFLPLIIDRSNLFRQDGELKLNIVKTYLEAEGRTAQDLQDCLPLLSTEHNKYDVIQSWFAQEGRTAQDLHDFRPLLTDPNLESAAVVAWIEQKGRTSQDLLEFLPLVTELFSSFNQFEGLEFKIMKSWVKEEGRVSQELRDVLPLLKNPEQKNEVARLWFKQEGGESQDLIDFLPLIDNKYRQSLIVEVLRAEPNPESKYNNFLNLSKLGLVGGMYNTETIVSTYKTINLDSSTFGKFCSEIYPNNESLQSDIFCAGMNRSHARITILPDDKEDLCNFVQNLRDDEEALRSLEALKEATILPKSSILELTSARLNSTYQSISEALKKCSLEASLSPDGLRSVEAEFGISEGDVPNLKSNLSGLMSYYDLQNPVNGLAIFKSLLTNDALETFQENFKPSDKFPVISQREYAKLKSVFATEENGDLGIIPVSRIASYLEEKVKFENINIATFKFGDSELLNLKSEEVQKTSSAAMESKEEESKGEEEGKKERGAVIEKYNSKFITLCEKQNPTAKEISEFFKDVLNLENDINHQEKFKNFFTSNKQNLAITFSANKGLDSFANIIGSLGDGCVANIATQANIALNQTLITLPSDQIIFGIYNQKISTPILNSEGDHLTGSSTGINIFKDRFITQNLISPPGILKVIKEEFYKNSKIVRNSTEFAKDILGQDMRDAITEILLVKPDQFNDKFSDISTYLVLKNTMPDLLKNKHLAKFSEECEMVIETGRMSLEDVPATDVQLPIGEAAIAENDILRSA